MFTRFAWVPQFSFSFFFFGENPRYVYFCSDCYPHWCFGFAVRSISSFCIHKGYSWRCCDRNGKMTCNIYTYSERRDIPGSLSKWSKRAYGFRLLQCGSFAFFRSSTNRFFFNLTKLCLTLTVKHISQTTFYYLHFQPLPWDWTFTFVYIVKMSVEI